MTVDSSSMLGVLSHIEGAPPELAQLANVGYLLIGIGSVLAIMGFLGCCGAITENKCMLLMVSDIRLSHNCCLKEGVPLHYG